MLNIRQIIGKDKTHYIKFIFPGKHDISIRYHYQWQNNTKYENTWVIKDHQDGLTQIIDEHLAIRMIEDLSLNKIKYQEIIGFMENGRYTKKIINKSGKHVNEIIDDKLLDIKHFKRISKKLWKRKNKTIQRQMGDWIYKIHFIGKVNLSYLTTKDLSIKKNNVNSMNMFYGSDIKDNEKNDIPKVKNLCKEINLPEIEKIDFTNEISLFNLEIIKTNKSNNNIELIENLSYEELKRIIQLKSLRNDQKITATKDLKVSSKKQKQDKLFFPSNKRLTK
jgi:hypothetical protein